MNVEMGWDRVSWERNERMPDTGTFII